MEDSIDKIVLPYSANSFKFAASRSVEIAAMTESILRPSKTKLIFQTLPTHMRRRVMSHNCKRLPRKQREGHLEQLKKSGLPPKQKRPSRKYRRRPANLLEEYNRRQRKYIWLETHIWHAKRFHMVERWGHRLAYAPCDKAFRACYRATSAHCLMQDISYYTPMKLTGSTENIGKIFSNMTHGSTGLGICAKAFLNGSREGYIHVYNNNSFPRAYIGKLNFVWTPGNKSTNTLWLFVHPSIIKEIELVLNSIIDTVFASEVYESDTKKRKLESKKNTLIDIQILPGNFNRFRLTGPNSHSILVHSLKTIEDFNKVKTNEWISNVTQSDLLLSEKDNYWSKLNSVNSASPLPTGMVLGLLVRDPRLSRPGKRTKAVSNGEQCDVETLITIPKCASASPLWNKNIQNTLKKNRLTNGQFIKHITETQLVPGEVNLDDPALQSVPVILIQRPGSQNANLKKIGYGSGWDLIIPTGYALPFWLTFIMFGARAGGLRETENFTFEMGECYFTPDSNAGKLEEKRIKVEKRERYFRLPPSKRVNFIKLGIKSPFICPWKILLKDWCSVEQANLENYFVLRDKVKLNLLQECIKCKKKSPEMLDSSACLVPIYLKIVNKGNLSSHALICAPQNDDILNQKTLFEPQHVDYNEKIRKEKKNEHLKVLKQVRRRRIKLKRKKVQPKTKEQKTQKKKKTVPTEYEKIMRELWVPSDFENIRHHCSRETIGFITKAAFSFTEARSCAIGYIPYNALSSLLANKQKQVLVRNITSRKYRLADIEIVQNM